MTKRSHTYIQLEVSFLCTIVRNPDNDYYKNMSRVMKYIQVTIGLLFILSIDKFGNIMWYVDAAFTVHKDMRIHNGGFITMVTGGSYVQYIKKLTPRFQLRPSLLGWKMSWPR